MPFSKVRTQLLKVAQLLGTLFKMCVVVLSAGSLQINEQPHAAGLEVMIERDSLCLSLTLRCFKGNPA